MNSVAFAAEVLVGDGFQDVGVDATNVLVGAPHRESADPDAVENRLQDLGEVLVRYVEHGEAGFIVLVHSETLVKRNPFVVTFLEKEGDRPEGAELCFPVGTTVAWGWRRQQVSESFLVGESTRIVRVAASFHDGGDHVSVCGPFVPHSPEAVEPPVELGEIGVDVGGVGGSKSETDPRGSSARSRPDGVDDRSLQSGEWLFGDGLNLTAVEGEGNDFPTYRL